MDRPRPDGAFVGNPYHRDTPVHIGLPAARRRRRLVAASLAAALIGSVAVDRIVAAHAESRIAAAFQDGMATADRPTVHVSGFPVLTQLAGSSLDHVDLTAHDIPANGTTRPLPVTKLTVGLDGLRTSGSADEAHARSVEATAFLSYDDVSNALGVRTSQGNEAGRINATATMPLAGDVTVSAAVSAARGNRIAFTDVRPVRGELPASLTALLNKALEEPVPLENVPAGLRLRSVTPTRDGIEADFTGRSVTFRPGSAATA
ncbi:DUF2993 domain-containing protein [Streptomyces sp. NPDC050759]|uniref:DUF2993 domain-containing protein n=1 Tax=Streptomyces sp. NPDC050759 TaxID=3365635 RepID=UPI0037A29983